MKTDDSTALNSLTERAEQLEDSGQLQQALEVWREALRHHTTPYLLASFGRLAAKLDALEEAESALKAAIELAPEFPSPYTFLGLLYLKGGRYEEAEEYFRRAVELDESPETLTMLGIAQWKLGTAAAARWSYGKAINLDPTYEEAYYNLALTYTDERPTYSVELFERAIQISPDYALAHRELGWVLKKLGKYKDSELHIKRAIQLDASDGWAHIYLGNLLWSIEDFDAAESAFNAAIRLWPNDATPLWALAIFYEHRGRTSEATKLYEQALKVDPDDPVARERYHEFLGRRDFHLAGG